MFVVLFHIRILINIIKIVKIINNRNFLNVYTNTIFLLQINK